ncbi:MAG: tetratricopeptide repeat protein [Planctomycetota bacterium]|nr:MAG: tetratricopeptide repeat protein [Planctomycetota bacterium]
MSASTQLARGSRPEQPRLVDRLAEEMAVAWQRGESPPAEVFLERHPELVGDAEEAVRLIYEEVCLRQERGEQIAADELARRFPQWADELSVLLDCHRLMQTPPAAPLFPGVGELLGDLQLVAELGRGKHGRVYLATQTALADRPVVLKITPRRAQEHLSLARLQHTHIIPLYAINDFPDRNLRALCMPFLGGATLARVLEFLHGQPATQRTGRSLTDALEAAQKEAPLRLPGRGSYLEAFACASYVDAVCCLGACLADGLQYAHERGLVHLDLKPSNVLLAADGQPLLLDFHLAREPIRPEEEPPQWLGGTAGYMSPEQEAALGAVQQGRNVERLVDGRSDIYALGVVLYEALGGAMLASAGEKRSASTLAIRPGSQDKGLLASGEEVYFPPLKPLPQCNPQVSVGLADVVGKCLAARPDDRYPDAAALAADLRRHLAHLPLRGVPNRSLGERWRKWRRRRPNASLWMGLLLALAASGATLAAVAAGRYRDVQNALVEGQEQMRRGSYGEAIRTLGRGKAQAESLPGAGRLAETLARQLTQARRAQAAMDLHAVADNLRFLAGADLHSLDELQMLESHCRTAWEARGLVADQRIASLEEETEKQVQADLLDLALLWVDLKRQLFQRGQGRDERAAIQAIFAEGQELLGPCPPLARERRLLDASVSPQDPSPPGPPHRGSWEHLALARSLLRSGDLEQAAEELAHATEIRPHDFWANFYGGVCAYRRDRFADAVHSFGVAIALAPASPECYYNRALAYAAWGKNDRALRDYDRALALAPGLAAAALNRGILHYQAGRHTLAKADLEQALRHGAEPADIHYNLALVHLAGQDQVAAQQHLQQALTHNCRHAQARALQERLQQSR